MSNNRSKIDRLGLGDRVQELLKDGVTVGRKIGRILRDDGHDISDSAVNRYLAGIRDKINGDAYKIIQEHVDETLPQDLDALETMESQCLSWAGEDPVDYTDRLAGAAMAIEGEAYAWLDMFSRVLDAQKSSDDSDDSDNPDSPDLSGLVKGIIKRCLGYVQKDSRLQAKRIQAMATAIKIIDLKLSKAGLLDDDSKGRIYIMDRSNEYDPDADPDKEKLVKDQARKKFVVHFGDKTEG